MQDSMVHARGNGSNEKQICTVQYHPQTCDERWVATNDIGKSLPPQLFNNPSGISIYFSGYVEQLSHLSASVSFSLRFSRFTRYSVSSLVWQWWHYSTPRLPSRRHAVWGQGDGRWEAIAHSSTCSSLALISESFHSVSKIQTQKKVKKYAIY